MPRTALKRNEMKSENSKSKKPKIPQKTTSKGKKAELAFVHRFVQQLTPRLRTLYYAARGDPEAKRVWTDEEVKLIAGKLYNLPPEKWNIKIAEPRLDLLNMLGVSPSASNSTQIFVLNVATYKSLVEGHCVLKAKATPADDFEPMVSQLLKLKRWPEEIVQQLVEKIKGVVSIDAAISSPEAFSNWIEFCPKWSDYVCAHPVIKQQVDPVYVVADIAGSAIPLWPPVPADSPLPPLAALDGAGYAWIFQDTEDASFWCGVVRNAIPGQKLWMFNCPTPSVRW